MVTKNKLGQGEIVPPQAPHLSGKNAEGLYVKNLEQATKLDYLGSELVPRSTHTVCRQLRITHTYVHTYMYTIG